MAEKTRIGKRKETYRSAEKAFKSDREIYDQFRKLNASIPARKRKTALSAEEMNKMDAAYRATISLMTQRIDMIKQALDHNGGVEVANENPRIAANTRKLVIQMVYMEKLRKTLSKDLRTIDAYRKSETFPTVSRLYENSRSERVEVDLTKTKKYGGAQNTRYKIEHEGKVGFFTVSKRGKSFDDLKDDIIKENRKKYGSNSFFAQNLNSSEILIDLMKNPSITSQFFSHGDAMVKKAFSVNGRRQIKTTLIKALEANRNNKKLTSKNISVASYNSMRSTIQNIANPEQLVSLLEALDKIVKADNYSRINEKVGIRVDSKQDKRNSAMSMIAGLMGCPGILAKSVNMQIKDPATGKIISGTYMENANGYDINSTDPEQMEKFNNLSPNKIEKSIQLKKDIANLQIVDFLGGNPDRHLKNVIYKFNESGDLVGITGIDNDTSFGDGDFRKRMRGTCLENMTVIPKETADAIEKMDRESLKFMLYGYDLSGSEVKKALERFDSLRDKLAADKEYFKDKPFGYTESGKIKIVGDDEIGFLSITGDLGYGAIEDSADGVKQGRPDKNLFQSIALRALNGKSVTGSIATIKSNVEKADADIVREGIAMHNAIFSMNRVEEVTINGSELFRTMITELTNANNVIINDADPFSRFMDDGTISINPERIKQVKERFETTLTHCDNYLKTKDEKKIMKKSKTSNAYVRYKLAVDAKESIKKTLKALEEISTLSPRVNAYLDKKDEMTKLAKKESRAIILASQENREKLTRDITEKQNAVNKGPVAGNQGPAK